MDTVHLVSTVCLFLQFSACGAIYYSQESPVFCLPIPSTAGTTVGRVFAYPNSRDNCTGPTVDFHIPSTADVPFTVLPNGSIVLNVHSSMINTTDQGMKFEVTASCKSADDTVHSAKTTVTLHPAEIGRNRQNDVLSEEAMHFACFAGMPSVVRVEENTGSLVLGTLHGCSKFDKYTRKYRVRPKNLAYINPSNTELVLRKPLDRERLVTKNKRGDIINVTGVQTVQIICDLLKKKRNIGTSRSSLNISVDNLNDSLPLFQSNRMQKLVTDKKAVIGSDLSVLEVIEDNDPYNGGLYTIKVVQDGLKLCQSTNMLCYGREQNKNICQLKVHIQNTDRLREDLYKCIIEITDDTYVPPPGSNKVNKATLVINIHKPSGPQNFVLKQFYRNATRLARLLEMREEFSRSHANNGSYSLIHDIFKVTRRTGIIYVDDTDRLATSSDLIALEVTTPVGAVINFTVAMTGASRQVKQVKDEAQCDDMCARHKTTKSCEGSCGLGLSHNGCVMRGSEHSNTMTQYGTCTYNIDFCPDRICDELEQMFPLLCPQDCITSSERTGAVIINSKTQRGIVLAQSPCWCEHDVIRNDVEVMCHCYPLDKLQTPSSSNILLPPAPPSTTPLTSTPTPKSTTTTKTTPLIGPLASSPVGYNFSQKVDQSEYVATQASKMMCDNACRTAIGLGLGAFIAISFSLFMLWFTKKRNDRRKSNMKHVGSVVSMSVVPSDYIDERENRSSYSSPQWSPKGPVYMTQSMVIENENQKWEFPRDNLTLDKTLGEGEFGVVVKGLAIGIDGENSVKEVAVKMLKHCSSQMEEMDLLSEFNLLKDVSHPNVIRLLGACTHDGPFYVIVEYCEHGCLLKYLRRSRLEEHGYVNTHRRFKSPNAKEQTDASLDGDLLSIRDLLSFAWQIAKGMSYLGEIKLVHRDLAARNVLVAKDKVLKISDFGLTRDVYEADTYLKKSKGRIPVKWLAPESLYAQIYTTRSDIWSYGIVLWEIVTLGAPPYPGIPPERLYNLLLGGYRMDKPENCPDEMYAVMQKCWKIDAADRPSFASLADIFDRILQEKTGYLDLTQLNGHDLYSKCFDSSMQDAVLQHSRPVREQEHPPTEDPGDRMNITTVCNDSYLTPLNLRDSDKDKLTPLLGNRVTKNRDNSGGHVTSKGSGRLNSNMVRRNPPTDCNDKIVTKNMKNKHVIYPSEKVSLLVDHNTAKFTNAFNGTVDLEDCQIELIV